MEVAVARSSSRNQSWLRRLSVPMHRGPAAAFRIWPRWSSVMAPGDCGVPAKVGTVRMRVPANWSRQPRRTACRKPATPLWVSQTWIGKKTMPMMGPQLSSSDCTVVLMLSSP
jgi:hypothetical protein